jgi:hypothetical protein
MPDNRTTEELRRRRVSEVVGIVLLVFFSLVLLPVIPFMVLFGLARRLALRIALLVSWVPHGRRALFVYSDSPVWREHVRERILPRLPANTVVLNWSERATWPRASVTVWAFRDYAGRLEFNPFGLVVPPFGRARRYRFWRPFRELKHGKPESLQALEKQFLDDLAAG